MASSTGFLHQMTSLRKCSTMDAFLPDCDIFLKMDSEQETGSFKMRGVGHHCQQAVKRGYSHLIGASGGNAGLAIACAAERLGVDATIYIPKQTEWFVIDRLKKYGARVVVGGEDFHTADMNALQEAKKPGMCYIHPYDHPEVWEGNATVILEVATQLHTKPSVIVLAVGGGGLLCGVLQGLQVIGWADVPVVAMETIGADCFNRSLKAKRTVVLDEITSVVKTLGARKVCARAMEMLQQYNVISEITTDADAIRSCLQFYKDEATLVDPACGATLSAVYCGVLKRLEGCGQLQLTAGGPVLVIVCGGCGWSVESLRQWCAQYGTA